MGYSSEFAFSRAFRRAFSSGLGRATAKHFHAQGWNVIARHYLENTSLPVAEISFLLGFSEPNSFYRAFRAWTGTSPEQVRRAV